MGGGGLPPLKVDPELLERYGNQLLTAAGGIPEAPPPFVVSGTDPMSQAIAEKLPSMEGPIQDELPQLKEQASQTATKIVSAAGQYQHTDEQLAAEYEKHQFDSMGGPGTGGAGALGQMGQLMSMPMQMAGQAAQLPMQAMGAVAAVPQGVQQGVQQISQMAGGLGGPEGGGAEPRDRADRDYREQGEAAAAGSGAERAPASAPPVARPHSPRHAAPDPAIDL
jgi:hypothetical protein